MKFNSFRPGPMWSTTSITVMGHRQCLPLSIIFSYKINIAQTPIAVMEQSNY